MSNVSLPKIVTVVGPTASGKTSLGVFLAKKFNGEIISADSRQVYRGLDLGTGKEGLQRKSEIRNPKSETNSKSQIRNSKPDVKCQMSNVKYSARWLNGIPQYLIDIKNPEEKFNVYDFKAMAELMIEDITTRNRLPLIIGGTGLYIDALVENYDFAGRDQKKKNPPKYQVLQIGIKISRDELHRRIDLRVDQRVKEGMIREVKELIDSGVNPNWLISLGLEYKFLTEHLIGKIPDLQIAIQQLKFATHAFARRQETWFRRHGDVKWISAKNEAEDLIRRFLAI